MTALTMTQQLAAWRAEDAAERAAYLAALKAECAERAKEIAVPVSLLKPRCDACRELFEPSELTEWYPYGRAYGIRRYCRVCNLRI